MLQFPERRRRDGIEKAAFHFHFTHNRIILAGRKERYRVSSASVRPFSLSSPLCGGVMKVGGEAVGVEMMKVRD